MTDTQALIERLRDDNSDTPYTERHEAAAELTRLTTALTEAEAKLAKAMETLEWLYNNHYNPFEPDNQTMAFNLVSACLAELGSAGGKNG